MDYAIKLDNISKYTNRTNKKNILDNVSLNIKKGSIYGIIGKNGAGKTTVMRVVCGLATYDSGKCTIFGSDNLEEGHKRMGILIERPALIENLSARENMEYFRMIYGILEKSETDRILNLVGVNPKVFNKVKNLSLGMKQRVGIAIALLGNPDILVLDEPVNGLDAQGVYEIRNLLLKLNKDFGVTIFISSHILSELTKIATNYAIIDNGKIIDEFTREELEEKNKNYISIKVNKSDMAKVIYVLEEVLKTINYEIFPYYEIRIFENVDVSLVNLEMVNQGVRVLSIKESSKDLEEYFVNLLRNGN